MPSNSWSQTAARPESIGIVILCSVQNFGHYGIMIWLPTYLAKTYPSAEPVGAVLRG